MALSTDTIPVPASTTRLPSRLGVIIGWAAVAAALVVAAVVALLVYNADREPAKVNLTPTVAEHGSVTAIDHGDLRQTLSRTVAEHGGLDRPK